MMPIWIVLEVVASILAAGVLVVSFVGVACARRVLFPRRQPVIEVIDLPAPGVVRLTLTASTALDGEYGLLFDSEQAHARIGRVIAIDHGAGTVDRVVEATPNSELIPGTTGRWTGNVFPSPAAICENYREVWLDTEGGPAPAWMLPSTGGAKRHVWAVQIHGQLASRQTTLRTARLSHQLGFSTLIPSFRNDGEGPQMGSGASMLGQMEWRDVEAAISYAAAHGAKQVVLFGWSMGGSIALTHSERSRYKDLIAGLVLVSPVTSWWNCIRIGIAAAGYPQLVARLTRALLESPRASRLIGAAGPIDFDELDWTRDPDRLTIPTLVVHSFGDTTVSFMDTERFAACSPDLVEIFASPDAPHALEWNRAPEDVDAAISAWIQRHIC
jgi:pimeloyl-ACP methyl ester carboxylesterase